MTNVADLQLRQTCLEEKPCRKVYLIVVAVLVVVYVVQVAVVVFVVLVRLFLFQEVAFGADLDFPQLIALDSGDARSSA